MCCIYVSFKKASNCRTPSSCLIYRAAVLNQLSVCHCGVFWQVLNVCCSVHCSVQKSAPVRWPSINLLLWCKLGTSLKAHLMWQRGWRLRLTLNLPSAVTFMFRRYNNQACRSCLDRLLWPAGCLWITVDVSRHFQLAVVEVSNVSSFLSNTQEWLTWRKHPNSCANGVKWDLARACFSYRSSTSAYLTALLFSTPRNLFFMCKLADLANGLSLNVAYTHY